MIISKNEATAAIETKLEKLTERLTKLGDLVAQEARQQEKITELLAGEKAILADSTLTEKEKVNKLLKHRATLDVAHNDLASLQSQVRNAKPSAIESGIDASQLINAFSDAVRQSRMEQTEAQLRELFEDRFHFKIPEIIGYCRVVKNIDDLERPVFVGVGLTMHPHDQKHTENSNLEFCEKLRERYETLAGMAEAHSELQVAVVESWL